MYKRQGSKPDVGDGRRSKAPGERCAPIRALRVSAGPQCSGPLGRNIPDPCQPNQKHLSLKREGCFLYKRQGSKPDVGDGRRSKAPGERCAPIRALRVSAGPQCSGPLGRNIPDPCQPNQKHLSLKREGCFSYKGGGRSQTWGMGEEARLRGSTRRPNSSGISARCSAQSYAGWNFSYFFLSSK